MCGAMWKVFVIFVILQVAILIAENEESPTPKLSTENVQGNRVTASLLPPTSTKQISASTTTTSPTTTKDIDECAPNPCQHGGTCSDGVNRYTCSCVAGYTDNNCQKNIDECEPNPCQHGGTCTDGVNRYTCSCVAGYTENNCQNNIDECAPNPCQHGGTCTDGVNRYTCSCVAGYTDNNCQTNIDDCEVHSCQNGGICTDGIDGYTCSCIEEYAGKNCQIELLPPGNISLQAVSTTVFTIHIVNASIQMFKITTNATKDIMYTNETNYKISGLTPGTCYRSDVCTFVPNKCSVGVRRDICLKPASPVDVYLSGDATTNSVPLVITRGDGIVSHFDILIHNIFHSSVIPSKYEHTSTNLEDLLPGSLYTDVSVRSVTNGLNSSTTALKKNIITVPVPPRSVEIINPTEKTFVRLKITRGLGKSEYFRFYWNATKSNIQVQNVSAANMNNSTYYLKGLLPGRTFVVHVSTVSHKKESAYYENEILVITKPDTPILQINDSATTENQISVTISKKDGGFDSFHIGSEEGLNYKIQGPRFTINHLKPGQRYHFWATVTYKNHESDRTDTLTVCTVPSSPKLEIMRSSTETTKIYGKIHVTSGGNDSFVIYNNDTVKLRYTIDGENFKIEGLKAGHRYYFQAATKYCTHMSNISDLIEECTVPSPPNLGLVKKSSTTNSLVGIINKAVGGKERFEIYCNTKERTKVVTENSSLVTINNLQPGQIYNCTAKTIFCNHTSATSKVVTECTVPAPPILGLLKNSSTTNSLVGNINKAVGGKERFEIYCNSKQRTKVVSENSSLVTINSLEPGQIYNCTAKTIFCNHTSATSKVVTECTVPAPPILGLLKNSSTTNSLVGNINKAVGGKERFEIYCKSKQRTKVVTENSSLVTINNLEPGQIYDCTAKTIFCNHTSATSKVVTECTVPVPPVFVLLKKSTTTHSLAANVKKAVGGKERFEIFCNGTLVKWTKVTNQTSIVNIHNLQPGHVYNCYATTIFCNHTSVGSAVVNESTVPSMPLTAVVQNSSNETMELNITRGNGSVDIYSFSFQPISNAKCAGTMVQRTGKHFIVIDSLSAGTVYNISIVSVFKDKRSSPYIMQQATVPSPPATVRIKEKKKDSVTIEIVKGKGCVKHFVVSVAGKNITVPVSQNNDVTACTVSGLDSATIYSITVFSVSSGVYRGEMSSIEISLITEKDPVPVAVGGIVGGFVVLCIILVIVVSWRRQALCFKRKIPKELVQGKINAGLEEEEMELEDTRRKRPIKLSEFHRHVEMMSRNTHMKFSQEFKELGIFSPKHSTDESQIQENRQKNRYTNILPFDHSIVKLIGVEDEIGSDFINANYIPGKKSKREFIATQGPLPSTKEEMWKMIWEQNVSIVVMLTQLIERGRKKCEPYWPENVNENMFLGDIIVDVETISHLPNYTLRTIALRLGDVERRIKHYNYLAWPDMGTPKTTDIMINFVDTVRQEVKPNMNGPIVVHCSAGVGRTGTFIIMDILLQEIRSKCTEVDIFGMILNMRNYRLNMVQTEDQYIFIHNCVKDLIDVSDNEEEEEDDRFKEQHEPIYQNC